MGWKHYQPVEPLKREPQVGRGLFGIRVLILHFKIQFSKFITANIQHFTFSSILTYPLKKTLFLFPKCPKKITQKFAQKSQTVVNEICIGI